MSFLARLGMRSVSKVEHSHGDPEVPRLSGLLIPTDVTAAAYSEESAVSKLVYDGNIFTSELVTIADGYVAEVNKSNLLVFNLRHIKSDRIVAQVCVDILLHFKGINIDKERNLACFPTGQHAVTPDEDGEYLAEYYFLAILN